MIKNIEYKKLSFDQSEIQTDDDVQTFKGYASKFDVVDDGNDKITKGAFLDVINSGKMPEMYFNHIHLDLPLGKYMDMFEDDHGLMVEGQLTPGNSRSKDVYSSMKHGTVSGLSIGYVLGKDNYEYDGEVRIIKKIKSLLEISIVTHPMNKEARVDASSIKSQLELIETITDFERFMRDACGLSRNAAKMISVKAKDIFKQRDAENESKQDLSVISKMLENFSHKIGN